MCISFVYFSASASNEHNLASPLDRYKLIILNNRDELFDRPATGAAWKNGILGGVDAKASGTWFCVDAQGRVGILLSITQPEATKNYEAPSRGDIPHNYLHQTRSALDYLSTLKEKANVYNGFQFICLERNSDDLYNMHSLTNMFVDSVEPLKWKAGAHVISNSPVDKPFKKTLRGEELFREALPELQKLDEKAVIERLMKIATDKTRCMPDNQLLRQTGRTAEQIAPFSAIFVRFPPAIRYGTRTHTIVLVDRNNQVTFYEKRITHMPEDIEQAKWEEQTFNFHLSHIKQATNGENNL